MKNCYLNDDFWRETYISELSAVEKLVFIFLVTNPYVNIIGIYPLPLHHICSFTDMNIDEINRILGKFSTDKKIYYIEGYVYIKENIYIKHKSEKIQKGISYSIAKLDQRIKALILKIDPTSFILNYDGIPKTRRPYYKRKRKELLKKHGNCCQKCGDTTQELDVDHINPLENGGSNEFDNLQLLCKKCHINKHSKTKKESSNG